MTDDRLKQEVIEAEQARCQATRERDLDALGRLLRDDYTHVTGRGSVMNREQYLEWVGSAPRRHERHDLQVRCYGDTAVIVGGLTNHLSDPEGNTRVIETTVTQVAVREGEAWRFVAFHITPKR